MELRLWRPRKIFYVTIGDLGDQITPEVKDILDSNLYLEWPEDLDNEAECERFFDKLAQRIRGEQSCGTCCQRYSSSYRELLPLDDGIEMVTLD